MVWKKKGSGPSGCQRARKQTLLASYAGEQQELIF